MVCGDWNKLDWLNYFSSVFNLMERDHFLMRIKVFKIDYRILEKTRIVPRIGRREIPAVKPLISICGKLLSAYNDYMGSNEFY